MAASKEIPVKVNLPWYVSIHDEKSDSGNRPTSSSFGGKLAGRFAVAAACIYTCIQSTQCHAVNVTQTFSVNNAKGHLFNALAHSRHAINKRMTHLLLLL